MRSPRNSRGSPRSRRAITLVVGAEAELDLVLGVATLAETVTVVGEAPLVEVARSQPSSVITGEQLAALPVLSRDFLVLAQLLPGAAPLSRASSSQPRNGTTKFGAVPDQRYAYTTQIDGGDVDDAIWGNPTINLGQDAIAEFKVFRNQFDAQYGKATTAVVSVVTKSGTNRFSGTGYYFGRDEALNARNAFAVDVPPFSADAARLFVRWSGRAEPHAFLHGVRNADPEHGEHRRASGQQSICVAGERHVSEGSASAQFRRPGRSPLQRSAQHVHRATPMTSMSTTRR